jgi:endonuclease/exonuclease/phosphatase (EEP) superfamily protein YafD
VAVAIALTWLMACGDNLERATSFPAGAVTLVTYNLAQIADGSAAAEAAAGLADARPDFLALEECVGCDAWLASDFAVTAPRAGVALGYDGSRWSISEAGILSLGVNDDGWGERVAAWGLFSSPDDSESIYVYATHWCVTIRTPDDACTVDRQVEYATALMAHLEDRSLPHLPVLIAGDFNVFDGFEAGRVISYLEEHGLTDLYRVANPEAEGTTFVGNSWAPPGRLDYIFATAPVDVVDARVDPAADASDHFPVIATVEFPEAPRR